MRSRHEKVAAAAIQAAGIETFLPLMTQVHQWSDRRKPVEVPMFPGYLFVRIQTLPELVLRVLQSPGVVTFVGNGAGATPIADDEINNFRTAIVGKVACTPYPFLKIGDRVRVVGGAFNGVEGVLVGRGPQSKLILSISLIQRSIAISVYNLDVVPVSHSRSAQTLAHCISA
jgi:transcription antitermination factor NusG